MRLSRFPLSTTKETPADAEIISHRLMLRAGLIRKLGAGLYTWMPLGLRVMRKVETIVREEMNRAGALELLMPTVQPAELWQESGRWNVMGDEMLRFKDRHKNDFAYSPTAEEAVTSHVRQDIRSYKQLPINYYQIQTKFRDERRPRFGVMRAREFVMKDAYSFHMDMDSLVAEYYNMRAAYTRIFTRIGADFRAVQADSGNIGGAASEEFHILAGAGEDLLAVSTEGDYAANVEAAITRASGLPAPAPIAAMETVSTPGQKTCEQVSKFMNVPLTGKVKLLVAKAADGGLIGIALRGDHELNEIKAAKHPKIASPFEMAKIEDVQAGFGCEVGYLGPVKCPIEVIADYAAAEIGDFVCGANENNAHLKGVNWGRDCAEPETADLRTIVEGDPSPDGKGTIKLLRGIEGGHIFQLGQKYTKAMNLTVLDEKGEAVTPQMGCYGIGVSRMVAAVIEQSFDANGIIWPDAIAPFRVIVTPIGTDKSQAAKDAAEKLYADLIAAGVEAVLDDRGLRPGPMFADADLIGIPHRIVIGDKGLANSQFEYKHRRAEKAEMIAATVAAVLAKLG
ncbi:MAG: proline--tRNA ligase [Hydrocarboniphaga sp.]|uniref:proline--tRNA ligase n=1 Tax=Hydrocarboniphaga sp. TaxID=2033016 RepID=UPI0026228A2C|nr:proline--tRNA ligase [Hydrocarboniphaga sp.]MDB5969636.1 proline--tRNA ligase [Hydrocarboniphaga sp.]